MTIFHSLNTSGSALTAQRLRMDLVSSNMANSQTTRATLNEDGTYDPYRRKMLTVRPREKSFQHYLQQSKRARSTVGTGVQATRIVEDEEPFKMIYNPIHPDADESGYVQMPNVDPLKEMIDLMSATRSYEANVTTMNASKNMLLKALEIGK